MANAREVLAREDAPLVAAAARLAREVAGVPAMGGGVRPRVLIVGGFVRDALLGLHPKDADVEVYGVPAAELKALLTRVFGKVKDVGEAFGILKVPIGDGLELDVSVPRRESKSGRGHAGFLVESDPFMSVEEAARRRDFTVNALAMDPLTGEVVDAFGGLADLESRTLRVTDAERFQDDPLRVLRAMQFVARLGFTAEPESARLMREMVERGDLAELSPERVTVEMEKLLLKGKRPSVGFEFARMVGVVERLFPELHATIGVPQEPEWHPEGDVWTHTLMVVDAAARIVREEARGFSDVEKRQVMLGALAHDFGKPATTRFIDGRVRSLDHEARGEDPARAFFSRLTFSQRDVEAAVAVTTAHLRPGTFYRAYQKGELNEKQYANAVRKFLRRLGQTSWRVIVAASEADARGRTLPGADTNPYEPGLLLARVVVEQGFDRPAALKPLLRGEDLIRVFDAKPGPEFRECFDLVEAARDAGEIDTREQALAYAARLVAEGTIAFKPLRREV